MRRIVDGSRVGRAPRRRTGRTGCAAPRRYAQTEAAARAGDRARWHRAEQPGTHAAAADGSYAAAADTHPGVGSDGSYAAAADAHPGVGIEEHQPREAQA
ncbi:hypothetical protein [Streptomyces sp. NBC_00582]|uniref:hypothetical protein n=1 Tax=Streptomyces sp. NBC_00582 TaxID=2975783 RepID=UPI00106292E9|nr:hypothetical protein [Streptomyces sp. NBC_00582]WUB63519.1 hypothetical protein OG852_25575 [Streptomyces sp. NBC_00582]